MRVFIKKLSVALFLAEGGKWVSNPEDAVDFGSGTNAIKHVRQVAMDNFELYYQFAEPRFDFTLNSESEVHRP